MSQKTIESKIRAAVKALVKTGMTQTEAIEYFNKDLERNKIGIPAALVYYSVTGKYLN